MNNFRRIISLWKNVFSDYKVIINFFVITLLFYFLNVVIANFKSLKLSYLSEGVIKTINFFFILSVGFIDTIKISSFVSLILISVLTGFLFSIIFFKSKLISDVSEKKTGIIASIGVFLGLFAPGCAACGIGLASALGISATFIKFFPLNGLEISLLSIAILVFAIYKISDNTCKIKGY